jgi:hypothetical protein
MLAEKFFLVLETIMSRPCPNGSSIVVSTSRHVPIKLLRLCDGGVIIFEV